jgi:hypothetical protein
MMKRPSRCNSGLSQINDGARRGSNRPTAGVFALREPTGCAVLHSGRDGDCRRSVASFHAPLQCAISLIRIAAPATAAARDPSTDRPTRVSGIQAPAAHACRHLVARSVLSPPPWAGPAWSLSRLDRGWFLEADHRYQTDAKRNEPGDLSLAGKGPATRKWPPGQTAAP